MPWEVWLCKRGNGLFRRLRFGFSGGLTLGVSNAIIPTMTDDATCFQKAAKSRAGAGAGAEKAERLARALRDNWKRRKAQIRARRAADKSRRSGESGALSESDD